MKNILKKVIATLIVTIMLFISCSQTLSYAADMYVKIRRFDNTVYYYDGKTVWDYALDNSSIGDFYCLREGADLGNLMYNDNYTKLEQNMEVLTIPDVTKTDITQNLINSFENTTGVTLKSTIQRFGKSYSGSKAKSVKALDWIGKNMYEVSSDMSQTEKTFMKNNIYKFIQKYCDSSLKNCNLDLLSEEQIGVIQQLVIWNFVELYENVYQIDQLNSVNDVKKISGIDSDEKAKAGFALYKALVIGAIEYANGNNKETINMNSSNKFSFSRDNNDKTIKPVEGQQNTYIAGPMTITAQNLEYLKISLMKGTNNFQINEWSILNENNSTILQGNSITGDTDVKDKLVGKTFYIKFKTVQELTEDAKIQLVYTYKHNPTLTNYSAKVYYKENRQPIVGINKSLNQAGNNGTVEFKYTAPEFEFDLALTKQIDKVYRYNGNEFKTIFNSANNSRLINIGDFNGTSTRKYYMNKEPVNVNPGDIVRYKITVYNEGDKAGWVKQIKDYLPEGLELVNVTIDSGDYHNQKSNNITYETGSEYIKYAIPQNLQNIDAGKSFSIYLDCRVSYTNTQNQILKNVAAITWYGYKNANGLDVTCTQPGIDIDSYQSNLDNNYSEYIAEIEEKTEGMYLKNIDKGLLVQEDDEDFEQVKVGYFDLALRKFITKVNDLDITDRTPKITNKTLTDYNNGLTTARYTHTKSPITVKEGDTVIYTIRIYNEGYIDGYAKEIKDYLPEGLKLKENSSINAQYSWKQAIYDQNLIYSDLIKNVNITPSNGKDGFANLIRTGNGDFWHDLQVECVVDNVSDKEGQVLTNMAEITSYGYNEYTINEDGTITTSYKRCSEQKTDIDSVQNTLLSDLRSKNAEPTVNGYYQYQSSTHTIGSDTEYKGLQDDDDFENVIVKTNKFDLTLRKFITKVNRQELQTKREPQIKRDSVEKLASDNTARYYHDKYPVTVNKGDIVTYTIRIYNEGEKDGIVKEITDYLPRGLELVSSSESQINSNNGWTATENTDGTTTIKTNISQFTVKASNGVEGYTKLANSQTISENEIFWKDIELECKVTSGFDGEILTNVAEISNYGYMQGNDYIRAEVEDRDIDSENNNVKNEYQSSNEIQGETFTKYYYNKQNVLGGKTLYSGIQDDDDFENIKVNAKYSMKLNLVKEDTNGNRISGAKFNVWIAKAENCGDLINSESNTFATTLLRNVRQIVDEEEINESKETNITELVAAQNYFYILEEVESNDSHVNSLEGYKILIPAVLNENGEVAISTTSEQFNSLNTNGFIIVKEKVPDQYVIQPNPDIINNADLINKVVISSDNTNGAQITVTVKNPEIDVNGSYKIRINKIDSSNSEGIGHAKFEIDIAKKVDGQEDVQEPTIPLDTYNSGNDKGKRTSNPITIDGVGVDEVIIKEIGIENNNSYIKLTNIPKLYITKEQTSVDTYKITKVAFEGQTPGTSASIEHQGVTLQARIIQIGEIASVQLTIPNKRIEGSYNLQIRKTDDTESESPISGVTFEVKDSNGNTVSPERYTTGIDGLTQIITRNIDGEGKERFDIKELSVGDNPYIKLKEDQDFSIFVTTDIVNNQYKATNVSFSDTDLDDNETEVWLENDLKVKASVKLDQTTGTITITVQNKPIEGYYRLKIKKVDDEGNPIKGIGFKATRNGIQKTTSPTLTNENGRVQVGGKYTIDSGNVNTVDKFEIEEIYLNNQDYITLKNPLTVYVHKIQEGSEYKIKTLSFNENDVGSTTISDNNVELLDNSKVTVKAEIQGNMIYVTIPNKPISGEYGINLLKVDDDDNSLEGVKFTITDIDGNKIVDEIESDENGLIEIIEEGTIISKSDLSRKEEYTITENKAKDGYMKFAENTEIKLYVTKTLSEDGKSYIAKASFAENEIVTESHVKLTDNQTTVPVTIANNGNMITIKLQNKELSGRYGLQIIKTDSDDKPLKDVEFEVKQIKDNREIDITLDNSKTDAEGKVTKSIINIISKDDVRVKDVYTIKEKASDNGYIALPEALTIYVSKDINREGTAYIATKATFDQDGKDTTKNIKLPNGKEVTVVLNVEDGMVKVTVPNRKIEGKYDLELIKLDQIDGVTPLSGVTFDIVAKKGTEVIKLYDTEGKEINTKELTTNSEGKIIIPNVKITEGAKYNFEITETKVPDGYVMLKDKIKVSFETVIDTKTMNYIITNMTHSGTAEMTANSGKITITVKNGYFDLALRKFITLVTAGMGTDDEKTVTVPNRTPKFKIDENGKYVYEHSKDPVLVAPGNVVEYTIRVYNEGSIAGYAKEIKDDIPDGLEFLPDNAINKKYGWRLLDEKGNEVTEVNKAKYIVTDYLSKGNESKDGENLLKAFNKKDYTDGKIIEPDYKDVKVAFKVVMPNTDNRILKNSAQIEKHSDELNDEDITDIDSTPGKWIEGDDDQDIEKVKVQYFDLALDKWVTNVLITEDGKETIVETGHEAEDDPEEIVKTDLKDSKINDVLVKYEYRIRIKNEGEIPGYAKEISDYIPEGLKFEKENNPSWEEKDGKIVTDQLKDTLLNPGETAEVSVILTWINSSKNLGLKVNEAEISKDFNEYRSPDIDSTPNNRIKGEDDIDDAPVMLTVKTGQSVTYVGLTIAVLTILGSGIVLIKKYVVK